MTPYTKASVLPRIPVATYRLQLSKNFTLADAGRISDYLRLLGISHIYSSPLLQAKRGSIHCYDVTDHGRINNQIGGLSGLEHLSNQLKGMNMGLMVDIVPNHMSTDQHNKLWQDILEFGPYSEYSSFFDVYWSDLDQESGDMITLPILGDQYSHVLKSEQLDLTFDNAAKLPRLKLYGSQMLPLSPKSYPVLLEEVEKRAEKINIPKNELEIIRQLRGSYEQPPSSKQEHDRLKSSLRSRASSCFRTFQKLFKDSSKFRTALLATIRDFNQTGDLRKRYRKMNGLLKKQYYRICYWRDPQATPNYRRFFYINDLIAIRAEDSFVFNKSHQLIFDLIAQEKIAGLRVDHIDGLRDPGLYLRRLQREFLKTSGAFGESSKNPLYVIVEKILADNELLPKRWNTYGTTGYDFSRDVGGLFVDHSKHNDFVTNYENFTSHVKDFGQIAYESKKKIISRYMSQEIRRLSTRLHQISKKMADYRSLTPETIRTSLEEVVAHFPVYRTYISPSTRVVSAQDLCYLRQAISRATEGNVKTNQLVLSLLERTMISPPSKIGDKKAVIEFVMRFQQITAPIVAKGIEDTAFYRYTPLVSLNEVGGNPEQFGISVEEFHERNLDRLANFPQGMLNTSTHDSKRSEDARSRISVLSEIPQEWWSHVGRWSLINESRKCRVGGRRAPDRNDEYLFYQALIGVWPLENLGQASYSDFVERIVSYMKKATKEAKLNTSWIDPDPAYDRAIENYVRAVLDRHDNHAFLVSFLDLFRRISYFGMLNSLSQLLLKLTSPGIPDIYQGNDIWDFSLVDPDNRRPVDFKTRRRMLNSIFSSVQRHGTTNLTSRLLRNWQDGAIKMFVTHVVLSYRNKHPELFSTGDYIPLKIRGDRRSNVCAFSRRKQAEGCVVIAPMLFTRLTGPGSPPIGAKVWSDTIIELPFDCHGKFKNLFTGESVGVERSNASSTVQASDALRRFPLAVLV